MFDRAMVEHRYETSGERVQEIRTDLDRFLSRLAEHPWGGPAFDRLVLATDLPAELKRLMPPKRHREWASGYENGQRIGVTGAIAFETVDGALVAVVGPIPDRDMLLTLAAHEAIEAAHDRRQRDSGYMTEPDVANAHSFWTEYVVERTRRSIFDDLQLGESVFDNGYLPSEADDLAAALPDLAREGKRLNDVPRGAWQRWGELVRTFATSQGRADAGYAPEQRAVQAFLRHPLIAESTGGWIAFRDALRVVYAEPKGDPSEHDARTYERWWTGDGCLYSTFGDLWNPRYAQALGVPYP